jgi:hypothetical protein
MTVLERSHFIDAMPINLEGVSVDTLKLQMIVLPHTFLSQNNLIKIAQL